ncbi:MAG: hypothetical protein FWG60_03405 [Methanomassiliicoccaceae archaeon]|nr:hypothetical protein [Methanomassiliicoccaceae archaeon]
MLYGVIVGTGSDAVEYMNLSYEDVLNKIIDRLLSDEQLPLTIWRRCCSSVHEHTISVETCNEIRALAGVNDADGDAAQIRAKLDAAVNNWYLRGKISLSFDGAVEPLGGCQMD